MFTINHCFLGIVTKQDSKMSFKPLLATTKFSPPSGGQTDGRTDGRTDKQTDGQMDNMFKGFRCC